MNVALSQRTHLRIAVAVLVLTSTSVAVSAESQVDKRLLAYWNFDEPSGGPCLDSSGGGHVGQTSSPLQRAEGLVGGALVLSGAHKVSVAQGPDFSRLKTVSMSAWVLPTELGGYREIFRKEDGDKRVLFSFQADGTILSLGLNIGGYIECDAPLDPAVALDGAWHHAAAVFDGQFMRVYFDGKEIRSLERAGVITAGGPAPGCIGSSNGGECFQGMMDELRIYREALSAEEVAAFHQSGSEAIEAFFARIQQQVDAVYAPADTFSQAMAGSRAKAAAAGVALDADVATGLVRRLKAEFPEDYGKFVRWAEVAPLDYLLSRDNTIHLQTAARLVDLLMEYRPLTDCQWEIQTPEALVYWDEAERVREKFTALQARGAEAAFSPEWIEIILEAGPRIDFRPRVSEAVAPYRTPQTPETRDLTSAEAIDTLQRDWLHQADGNPTPDRIRAEIDWACNLADRIQTEHAGQVDFTMQLAALAELEKEAAALTAADVALYFRVRSVKREIFLANPTIDFRRVVFVDMPFPAGSEWPHETRHRLGYMAVPGARLLILDGLSPSGSLRQLAPQSPLHGSFWRPDVSFDGSKILFCFKPHNEKSFHLYEIGVDGSGLTQLTFGQYDDFDPIYLPDGEHIAFSTTRGHTYVRCMPPTNAYVLARCDTDGGDIYLISRNNEPDYLPSVANDGRIIYTRWEYTDKPLWRAAGLWAVNPDGTQVNTLWGNQSVWPDLLKDVRAIPNSRRLMFTGSAHHDWFAGSVGIIDPEGGYNFPDGLTKVTADTQWPESGNGPTDPVESAAYHASGSYSAYYSPYPLSERDFLVSVNRAGKFVLYLMDVDGNRELVHEGVNNIFHAMPLRARANPPVIADRVNWPTQADRDNPCGGVIFSTNVYQGAPPELRDKARYLRILNIDPKTYTYWHKRPYASTGPVVSLVQSEGVKRVVGTVPIEPDGSVAFEAPTGVAYHFQLLDENYRALQTMRSFTGVMPGERRGCLGCHESHSRAPHQIDSRSLALSRQPSVIEPPPWGNDSVGYERYVQPILDHYCGECHQGEGEARQVLDLTQRPGYSLFDEPYVTLIGHPTWGAPYIAPADPPPGWGIAGVMMVEGYDQRDPAAYTTPAPMTSLSYCSQLVELASNGEHYDVRIDPLSLRKLIAWIDTMCPYRGIEEVRGIPDPEFQGVDWLSIRPRVETAPTIIRPGPVD